MNELQLTHGFIKKLTKNIREALGKDIAHTKVLELVADAAGQKAGPMMHALKNQATTGIRQDFPEASATIFSAKIAHLVFEAIQRPRKFDSLNLRHLDLTAPMELLDERVPLALLVKSLALLEIGGPAWRYALRAFEGDPLLSLIAASSLGETGLDYQALKDHFGDNDQYRVANWLIHESGNLLVFAAKAAVEAGFIRFVDGKAILVTPERMPSEYNYKFSELEKSES
jgi:hypothetical protein